MHGEPDYGSGNHGHICLGITVVHYNSISNTAYVQTAHPGAVGLVGATQHEISTLRDDWKRSLELYKEIALLEKAIKKQIIEIFDERDVETLVERTTHIIQRTIQEFLEFLFDRYGQIR